MNEMLEFWRSLLPTELVDHAYNLEYTLGIFELAWSSEDLISIFQTLEKRKILILGGDVYRVEKNIIEVTYDSWYYEGNDIHESSIMAQEYIFDYEKNNIGCNYVFSLILHVEGN